MWGNSINDETLDLHFAGAGVALYSSAGKFKGILRQNPLAIEALADDSALNVTV